MGVLLYWKRNELSHSNGCFLKSVKLRGDQVAACKDGGVQLFVSRGSLLCEAGDLGH